MNSVFSLKVNCVRAAQRHALSRPSRSSASVFSLSLFLTHTLSLTHARCLVLSLALALSLTLARLIRVLVLASRAPLPSSLFSLGCSVPLSALSSPDQRLHIACRNSPGWARQAMACFAPAPGRGLSLSALPVGRVTHHPQHLGLQRPYATTSYWASNARY